MLFFIFDFHGDNNIQWAKNSSTVEGRGPFKNDQEGSLISLSQSEKYKCEKCEAKHNSSCLRGVRGVKQ